MSAKAASLNSLSLPDALFDVVPGEQATVLRCFSATIHTLNALHFSRMQFILHCHAIHLLPSTSSIETEIIFEKRLLLGSPNKATLVNQQIHHPTKCLNGHTNAASAPNNTLPVKTLGSTLAQCQASHHEMFGTRSADHQIFLLSCSCMSLIQDGSFDFKFQWLQSENTSKNAHFPLVMGKH